MLLQHCVSALGLSDQQSTVCHEEEGSLLQTRSTYWNSDAALKKEPDRGGRGVV